MKPRIGFELASIWRPGGISDHQVSRGMLDGLVAVADDYECEIVVAVDSHWVPEASPAIPFETIQFRAGPRAVTNTLGLRSAYEGARVDAGLFHHFGPARFKGVSFALIHDVIPATHPKEFGLVDRIYLNRRRWFARRADVVLTVSEYSRLELVRRGYSTCENTRAISWGSVPSTTPPSVDPSGAVASLEGREFCLSVGRVTSRKRQDLIARAHVSLPHSGLLVFAGPIEDERMATTLRAMDRVVVLGTVDDDRLEWLLANCSFVVNASVVEGFGMPIVESLARARPVIASRIDPFVELGHGIEGCWFFEPDSEVDLAITMADVWEKTRGGTVLVDAEPVLRRYSWETTARTLLEAMLERC